MLFVFALAFLVTSCYCAGRDEVAYNLGYEYTNYPTATVNSANMIAFTVCMWYKPTTTSFNQDYLFSYATDTNSEELSVSFPTSINQRVQVGTALATYLVNGMVTSIQGWKHHCWIGTTYSYRNRYNQLQTDFLVAWYVKTAVTGKYYTMASYVLPGVSQLAGSGDMVLFQRQLSRKTRVDTNSIGIGRIDEFNMWSYSRVLADITCGEKGDILNFNSFTTHGSGSAFIEDKTSPCNIIPESRDNCGIQGGSTNANTFSQYPIGRIINGAESAQNEWPWQISLRQYVPTMTTVVGWHWKNMRQIWGPYEVATGLWHWEHICGGSIVSEKWIVTASHCVDKVAFSNLKVVVGAHKKEELPTDTVHTMSRIIMHADYVFGGVFPNDIALLELSIPITFSDVAKPICLPQSKTESYVGNNNCWITGWGMTRGTGDDNVLNELKINVLTYNQCWQYYRSIQPYHICLGTGTSGACKGDSGGPLACSDSNGKYVLAGATSWGYWGGPEDILSCKKAGNPNVYTRVSYYLDWIKENMAS